MSEIIEKIRDQLKQNSDQKTKESWKHFLKKMSGFTE